MTPWMAAYQAPPSMGFSRQEYQSGLPLPSPRQLAIACQPIAGFRMVLISQIFLFRVISLIKDTVRPGKACLVIEFTEILQDERVPVPRRCEVVLVILTLNTRLGLPSPSSPVC